MFPSLITQSKLDVNNETIENYCLSVYNTKEGRNRSNRNGYQSNNISFPCPLDDLKNEIEKMSDAFCSYLQTQSKVKVSNMWINVNEPHSYNLTHLHPNCFLSGVYYVTVPEKSGSIVFTHPCDFIEYDYTNFKEWTPNNSHIWKISPVVGECILFPSWLRHSVESNLSNYNRISISFNLK
jgi:uncharacterized protein (TIGR02466 family)